jgi:hypothetical protein
MIGPGGRFGRIPGTAIVVWALGSLALSYLALVLAGRVSAPTWIPNDRDDNSSLGAFAAVMCAGVAIVVSVRVLRPAWAVNAWILAALTAGLALALDALLF